MSLRSVPTLSITDFEALLGAPLSLSPCTRTSSPPPKRRSLTSAIGTRMRRFSSSSRQTTASERSEGDHPAVVTRHRLSLGRAPTPPLPWHADKWVNVEVVEVLSDRRASGSSASSAASRPIVEQLIEHNTLRRSSGASTASRASARTAVSAPTKELSAIPSDEDSPATASPDEVDSPASAPSPLLATPPSTHGTPDEDSDEGVVWFGRKPPACPEKCALFWDMARCPTSTPPTPPRPVEDKPKLLHRVVRAIHLKGRRK